MNRIFVFFVLSALIGFGVPAQTQDAAPKTPPRIFDWTESVLGEIGDENPLTPLRDFEGKQIKIKFYITDSASKIIEKRAFDLQDESFELDPFVNDLGEVFRSSLDYFFKIYPDAPVKETIVIINDFGNDRRNNSARAKKESRVIEIDIRRWHKMYRGKRQQGAAMSTIHEFTHVVNYMIDPAEDKYHREFSAIFFEMLNYVRQWGWQKFEDSYLEDFPVPPSQDIMSAQFSSYAPLRHLAYYFARVVHDGDYLVDPAKNPQQKSKTELIESFARAYLSNRGHGDAGFDAALREVGFQNKAGTPLTIALIRQDLVSELQQ